MANLYTPESLGIVIPKGLEGNGNWIQGRQIWNGQLSDPGVINPLSNQQGAGQTVSKEVNAQSAAAQGKSPQELEAYLQTQRDNAAKANVQPTGAVTPSTPGEATPSTTGAAGGIGITPPASINLPDLYNNLYKEAGVADLETKLSDKAKAFTDAQSKINDNPFLSEATRLGRISKLTTDYNSSVKNDQDALAMKKQDIATKIDLQTKQFDINSQAAKQALDQFNLLLQSGALSGASGNDIASITKATGISSTMVQAAIKAQTTKDTPTSVTTVDDGKNVYAVVINSKTGQLISKQVLAASKPTTTGTVPGSSSYKATQEAALNQFVVARQNSYGHLGPADWNAALNSYLAAGLGTRNDFILTYAAYTDPYRTDFEQATGYNFPKSIRDDVAAGRKTVAKPSSSDALIEALSKSQ